ncbi:MAG: leucine-rich repeat protein [Clostridia bacterium]|nr:leucine-rich repeat protein [Clostridia bacterium]
MKRTKPISVVLSVMLAFCLIFSALPVSANENTDGNFIYSIMEDNTAQIIGFKSDETSIEIPQKIGQYTVSAVGNSAFKGKTNLKNVTLPDTLKLIDDYAFDCCTNLEKITIPDSVEKIGKGAFFSCTRLKSVDFSENLKTIGDGAFYDCRSLESISLPDGTTTVGEYVFGNCKALQSAGLGTSLKAISNQVFINCELLKKITIPDGAEKIGNRAFKGCVLLESIEIPTSVKSIGQFAFNNCTNLTDLFIPAEKIDNSAFSYCSSLNNITFTDNLKTIDKNLFDGCSISVVNIPSGVEKIEYGAFANSNITAINVDENNKNYTSRDGIVFNKDMTEIIAYPSLKDDVTSYSIPDGVKTIAPYAFKTCWLLSEIKIPDSVVSIGDNAFESDSNLKDIVIPKSVTEIGKGAFYECSSLESIVIPSSVSEIKDNTFESCSALTNITISEGVTKIGMSAFAYCSELKDILLPSSLADINPTSFKDTSVEKFNVAENNENLTVKDGVLFSKDMTKLVAYPVADSKTEYTVPDGTKIIGEYAFANNSNLKSITVPESVTEIGKYAAGMFLPYNSDSYDRTQSFMLIGKSGSAAEKYANENDIAFFTGKPYMNSEIFILKAGETADFVIENADTKNLVFSSSDKSIADIDENGKITAVSQGQTIVFASTGMINFSCLVQVTSGTVVGQITSFRELTINDYEQWEKDYYELNKNVSFEISDNPNINCYSGNEYIPILAVQEGGFMLEMTKKIYGDDYGQYEIIADNISTELSKFTSDTDLILFSGTNDLSNITGKSSSLKDMRAAIGRRFKNIGVLSTSVAHSAAVPFGDGSYHTMLEIYAPASAIKGGYIRNISQNPQEYEILLDKGCEFEVMDAGVRQVNVTDFNTATESIETERYIKLKIVDHSEPEPTPPTESSVESSAESSTIQPSESSENSGENSSSSPENPEKPANTGDNRFVFVAILLTACVSLCIFIYLTKKSKNNS